MPTVAPSLRSLSVASIQYGSSSLVVPKPAGLSKDDVVVAVLLAQQPLQPPSWFTTLCARGLPGGWTGTNQKVPSANPAATQFNTPVDFVVAWKRVGDVLDEPAAGYTFQAAVSTPWAAIVAAYKDAGGVQAGDASHSWWPEPIPNDPSGNVWCSPVQSVGLPSVTTLYENCLVVGAFGTGPGWPPPTGPVSLMDWMTQGLTPRATRQIWSGINPLLCLLDGVQALAGVRSGMSALLESGGCSTAYSFALLPRIPTSVTADAVAFQQELLTEADGLQVEAATPQTIDGAADFSERIFAENDSDLGVEGEAGSTRVTVTWTRRGVR